MAKGNCNYLNPGFSTLFTDTLLRLMVFLKWNIDFETRKSLRPPILKSKFEPLNLICRLNCFMKFRQIFSSWIYCMYKRSQWDL